MKNLTLWISIVFCILGACIWGCAPVMDMLTPAVVSDANGKGKITTLYNARQSLQQLDKNHVITLRNWQREIEDENFNWSLERQLLTVSIEAAEQLQQIVYGSKDSPGLLWSLLPLGLGTFGGLFLKGPNQLYKSEVQPQITKAENQGYDTALADIKKILPPQLAAIIDDFAKSLKTDTPQATDQSIQT
jgi:hypothetical protein